MQAWVPWVETLGVILLGLTAAIVGRHIGQRHRWWPAVTFVALALLLAIGAARWQPRLEFEQPMRWMMRGRREHALFAPLLALAMVPPLTQVRSSKIRQLAVAFLVVVAAVYSINPFLRPALVRKQLTICRGYLDADHIYRQATTYTCGPAAAVTALRRLGIDAGEGEMAIRMGTSPAIGTPPDVIADVLTDMYASRGVRCQYLRFTSAEALRPDGDQVLTLIQFGPQLDHYVTVISVSPDYVVVADPLKGRVVYPRLAFEKIWRRLGVVITCNETPNKSREVDSNHRPAAYEAAALATELPRQQEKQ